MRKIPTLFVRNPEDRRHVIIGEVTPGCEWVLAGEGQASRKWDGTCIRISHGVDQVDGHIHLAIQARHTIKAGGKTPAHFMPDPESGHDPVTGKTIGWVPYGVSGFRDYILEALGSDLSPDNWEAGTYELIGPKVNGNPDKVPNHRLQRHGDTPAYPHLAGYQDPVEALVGTVRYLEHLGWEGLVWRHPDGRMAKLKARDLPTEIRS